VRIKLDENPEPIAGILLVRLNQPGRMAPRERIVKLFTAEAVEGWRGAFVVATDRKLRVRRGE